MLIILMPCYQRAQACLSTTKHRSDSCRVYASSCACSAQDKALERQRAAEGEAAHLRQAMARQAAGDTQTDTERCRQAEQLLAQQVCIIQDTAWQGSWTTKHFCTHCKCIHPCSGECCLPRGSAFCMPMTCVHCFCAARRVQPCVGGACKGQAAVGGSQAASVCAGGTVL